MDVDVVDVSSSDDENAAGAERRRPLSSSNALPLQTKQEVRSSSGANPSGPSAPASINDKQSLDSRSFWRAGDYNVGPSKSIAFEGHLEHARVHPKFLHSNATSHKWAFGAIAELLDNAVDEISNGATFVKVDKINNMKDNSPALLFHDDGGGMDPERLRKCMSLGYSSKKSNTTIGQYGNGFKTSTMRLGADVIVFSRANHPSRETQSVGLLSYTYLRTTGQDDVVVPMVDFDISDHWAEPIIYSSQDDWSANLKTILEWSPFSSKEELMLQFEDIGPHGTKVIIYNLWLNDEGIFELSFDDDDEDIRLRDEANRGTLSKVNKRMAEIQSHISYRIRYSLRAYASILYLRKLTNFRIILRGKTVQQFNIADELKYPKVVVYKPQLGMASKEVSVETKLGFIKEAPALGICGFNVYHKNRLIRPFWKITADGNSIGNGVVGVLEANFIEPAHDKQDFERSSLFIRLENKLKQMQLEYWKNNCHLIGLQAPGTRNVPKEYPVRPSVPSVGFTANVQKQSPVGLTANVQKQLPVDQPIIGISANSRQDMSNMQPGSSCPVNFHTELPAFRPVIGLADGTFKEAMSIDSSGSTSIDQLADENIELFMRREAHIQKENELKQMVEDLEKELKEAKRNCAQLASLLEFRKKQRTGKV
ncbi:protein MICRORCHIDIA 2-like [Malania oleifera]|uniref:protein MICRORCHIDIA 2-like n=1 Tax=Malania oleifera TaxID=397392 RepID=UPI0025ADBC3C|nr:protein MICRORCHIDIA 2-like [Malania oleifera]